MTGAPEDLAPGDEITSEWLEAVDAALEAAGVTPDPRSGVHGFSSRFGSALRIQRPPEGFYKVTASAAGTGGGPPTAALLEQVDLPGGTWADGPRTIATAYALPGSVPPPVGTIVYCWRARANWRFEYRACP